MSVAWEHESYIFICGYNDIFIRFLYPNFGPYMNTPTSVRNTMLSTYKVRAAYRCYKINLIQIITAICRQPPSFRVRVIKVYVVRYTVIKQLRVDLRILKCGTGRIRK